MIENMIDIETQKLLVRYKSIGLVLDTNLALLMLIGFYDANRIPSFKRTQKYRTADYALLLDITSRVSPIVVTPNIVTEVDNLARQLPSAEHAAISQATTQLYSGRIERYVPTDVAVRASSFNKYGVTDAAVITLSEKYLVVTDDFALSNRIINMKRHAINLNHLRAI